MTHRRGWRRTGAEIGSAYLIHLDRPIGHAQHYSGFAVDLPARLRHHKDGTGARLLAVARERGIGWSLARVWERVTPRQEQRIKHRKGSIRALCPICAALAAQQRV